MQKLLFLLIAMISSIGLLQAQEEYVSIPLSPEIIGAAIVIDDPAAQESFELMLNDQWGEACAADVYHKRLLSPNAVTILKKCAFDIRNADQQNQLEEREISLADFRKDVVPKTKLYLINDEELAQQLHSCIADQSARGIYLQAWSNDGERAAIFQDAYKKVKYDANVALCMGGISATLCCIGMATTIFAASSSS